MKFRSILAYLWTRRSLSGKNVKASKRRCTLAITYSSKWGASPHVMCTTGLALSISAGEYACSARNLFHTIKDSGCSPKWDITGCLKPTPVKLLYPLAGITLPDIRSAVAVSCKRVKMAVDTWHLMYNIIRTRNLGVTVKVLSNVSIHRATFGVKECHLSLSRFLRVLFLDMNCHGRCGSL